MNKLILESILLFLLGLMNVQVSLANYTSILEREYRVCGVVKVEVKSSVMVVSSDVLYVRYHDGRVIYSVIFNQKEVDLLMALGRKIGSERFGIFMDQCNGSKDSFMELVRLELAGSNIRIARLKLAK